ncbi:MAG: ABC transporter ATP-binding protein/permease [candidate division Zixibacteria bacterium]|nr:ABC transporter ATP-binding protein/permease [candidate division Zixibacteria bacterium]
MISAFYEDEKAAGQEGEIGSRRAFGRLIPLLKARWKSLAFCFSLLATTTVLSLLWPILLKDSIDGPMADGDLRALLWLAGTIALIQIVTVIMQYFLRVRLEIIGQDMMLQLKQRLFKHILTLDVAFFDRNPVGRLMARVESDTEALRLLFTNTVLLVISDLLMVVGIYSVLFYYSWQLSLALVAVMPIIALITWIFHRLTTHRFLEVRKRMAEVTATLTEYLHGMSIIQIFHRGRYARQRVFAVNEAKFSEDAFVNISVCIFFNTVFFFEYVKIGLVLLLGHHFGLTAGLLVLFLVNIWRSFEPIFRTSEQLANFQKGVAGAKRIFALLEVESQLKDAPQPIAWPGIRDRIRFENVWFAYDDENWILRDVSFEVPVGRRVALAGVTGGGKSTVISLMLRLYDPQKGRITIDGVDIRHIAKDELRRHFALVLQDIFLFPGTVAENISLDSDAISEDRIRQAAHTVAADAFIDKLEKGFATEVSEKGANFSRGERQLLSFARALAVDPDVLVLDEATSSVDPETERTIQESLTHLTTGRTSIIIAHRLSTILDVDQILVIRRGEIVERGTHIDLILQDGYYAKLFHLQFKHANGVTKNVG